MEIHIFEFPKIAKKITSVGRVETHTRDFFYLQNRCILGCAKKTNSDRFQNFESGYVDSEICLLDLAQNKTNLDLKFGTLVDLGDIYTWYFFLDFWKPKCADFNFFKNRAPWSSGSKRTFRP
jgi:hypothetical protein